MHSRPLSGARGTNHMSIADDITKPPHEVTARRARAVILNEVKDLNDNE